MEFSAAVEIFLAELEGDKYIKQSVAIKYRHKIQYTFPLIFLRFYLILSQYHPKSVAENTVLHTVNVLFSFG
jgi:hypothetical protein